MRSAPVSLIMSVSARTLHIADAAYSTILCSTNIRLKPNFALSCGSVANVIVLVVNNEQSGSSGFDLFLPKDIEEGDRVAVIQLIRHRLIADRFHESEIVDTPVLFKPVAVITIDMAESNKAKAQEPNGAHDTTKSTAEIDEHGAHASFFRRVCLTPDQLRAVQAELPVGAPTDDLFLLSCFSADVLRECGLTRVQIAAWEKLIAEQTAA